MLLQTMFQEKLKMIINKKLPLICVAVSVLSLTACYNGKGVTYYPPRTAIPASWAAAQENDALERAMAKEKTAKDIEKNKLDKNREDKMKDLVNWWKVFDDQTLNKLVIKLSESNLDIKIAAERIKQARALQGVEQSDLFPNLDLSLSGSKIGTSHNGISGTGVNYETYGSSIDSSWEIDLFGKNLYKSDAAAATTQMFEASYNNIMVSMIAEIATNYIELRAYQERLAIARKVMETQYKAFEITTSMNDTGLVDDTTKLQTKMILENARAAIPLLKTEVEVYKNRIAVLLGKAPQDKELDFLFDRKNTLPETSIKLAIGIPADSIRRRPDIVMAERNLAAEVARVGQRRAELYPSLKLGGSIGLESLSTGSLFDHASNIFSLSSVINWNIFDTGKLRQNLKYQKAVKEETALEYEKAVLNALAEVQNSIVRFTNEKIREHNLKQSLDAADKNLEIAESKYNSGRENLTLYLGKEVERLNAEDQLIVSKSNAAVELINLYKALGGGWQSFSDRNIIHEEK